MKRNSVADILRFIFAIVIAVFHFQQKYELDGYFINGFIGVEYFFLISGWFMVKNAEKQDNKLIGEKTYNYVLGKIKSFIKPYFICWMGSFILNNIYGKLTLRVWFFNLIEAVPSFIFLHTTGIKSIDYLSQTWYISAMLFTIVICYPLLLKFKDVYVYCVSPIVGFLLLGYMCMNSNNLASVDAQWGITTKGTLRALAVMNLGVFSYGIGQKIKDINWTKTSRTIFGFIEVIFFVFTLYYATFPITEKRLDYVICIIIAIALMILLTIDNFISYLGDKLNSFAVFLGRYSLYVYLIHIPIKNTVLAYMVKHGVLADNNVILCCVYVALVIGGSVVVDFLVKFMDKILPRIKKIFIGNTNDSSVEVLIR